MKNKHTVQIDTEKCIGCGLCQKDCPSSNIVVENKKAGVIAQDCIMCGHCVAVCPKAAVSMTGFDSQPEDIMKPVRLDPGELLAAIRTRRSIRQFTDQQIAPELIEEIIEAGRLTPTGKNVQDVSYVVLKDGMDQFETLAVRLFRRLLPMMKLVNPVARRTKIDDHFFFKNAPAAIMIVSPDKMNGTLAASTMALMAEACGLGVLYSGFFSMAASWSGSLRRALGLKHGDKVVTTLVLGYAGVRYHRTAPKEAASVRQL